MPLYWFNAPDSWKPEADSKEGLNGSWNVSALGHLTIVPPAKKDFWRKTYYDPPFIKDDGSVLHVKLPQSLSVYTVETEFLLKATRQFDQAGIMVRMDHQHWLKTGIEVVDGRPRLSCVVTNSFSDWSTQNWPDFTTETVTSSGVDTVVVHCHLRVHARGESFVVEGKTKEGTWEFIRIAHMSKQMVSLDTETHPLELSARNRAVPSEGEVWVGVFACSPVEQHGCSAVFSMFQVNKGSSFDHNADQNLS